MSKPKYTSLEEYLNEVVHQAVEECILCGECLRHCLTYPLSPLKDKDPEDIMMKIIDFLKNGVYSDEVYLRAFSCAACENCNDSCPQGINPQLIHEAAKIKLFKQEGKQPKALNFGIPGQKMNINAILSGIQMKPTEERWLKRVPSSPRRTENVVFLGCAPLALPDKIFTFLDILERMGIDFIPLAGGELCCGLIYFPAGGKVKESEEKGRELIASIKAFSPKRVILICTGCYRQFTEFFPNFSELDFEVQYYTQFLSDNLEKLDFINPLEETITFHDSCFLARGSKDTETPRKILEAIPGLKIVEMERTKEQTLCCGGLASISDPQIGQKMGETLIEETRRTGADYLVNACPACYMSLHAGMKGYPIGLKEIVTLINDATGGREYECKYDTYSNCKNVEEIINKSRENFEANGYTEEEMRHVLPLLFHLSD